MATPIDFGFLAKFGDIFPFLFVLIVVYAALVKIKVFGDNKTLNVLIALVLALITMLSRTAKDSIMLMAPWFVLFFFLLVFLSIAYMMFGAKTEDFYSVLKNYSSAIYWVLAIVIMIWLGSITSVLSQQGGVGTTTTTTTVNASGSVMSSNQQSAFWATLTHPKVLGLALILLIATFTIQRLTLSQ
ncbi:MAG: hypothetical protein V1837_02425 [Candidatus Woesearchaeota archaeon]